MLLTLPRCAEDIKQPITHVEARALYDQAEKALLTVQISIRGFILARWLLGQYFSYQKDKLGARWLTWLKSEWPQVSNQTAKLWMAFYSKTPMASIKETHLSPLKKSFVKKMHKKTA